ncbi:MAG: hypothetical protein IJM98_08800 [Oscillospiraceae bacterium]|nr:hypothetical protein [Oscillospiraceae bacterium]
MVNIEEIRAEVEKLTPKCCRIDEEVYNRLKSTAEYFKELDEKAPYLEIKVGTRKSALPTSGYLRVDICDLSMHRGEENRRLFEAMDNADVYEIYSVVADNLAIDLSYRNMYVIEDGYTEEDVFGPKKEPSEREKKFLEMIKKA